MAGAGLVGGPTSSFVGRGREVDEVVGLLGAAAGPAARLVTLTGPGGVGKTRLAQAVAADPRATAAFPHGVVWIDLVGLADPGLVATAVAEALGARDRPESSAAETVVGLLRALRVLLVLDNCEHVLGACAGLAAAVLSGTGASVLATSRAPLEVPGELAWSVPGLSLPGSDGQRAGSTGELERSEAVRLFVDRAAAVRRGFALTDENVAAVAAICRRVEGLPLAIELAAARVRVLSPAELAERLEAPLAVLTRGSRVGPPRHETLRAAIDWSHELLGPIERVAFRRLGAFVGGWTLASAEAVVADPPGYGESTIGESDVLDLLDGLARLSLVVADERDGAIRFRLLEPIREYALEQLRASGEAEVVAARHADHFLSLGARTVRSLFGEEPQAWRRHLANEPANLRAALLWLAAHGRADQALRTFADLHRYWHWSGRCAEALALGRRMLAAGPAVPTKERAAALHCTGAMAYYVAENDEAAELLEAARAAAELLGDQGMAAHALLSLGKISFECRRDFATADRQLGEGLRLVEAHGHAIVPYEPNLLAALGHLRRIQARVDDACATLERAAQAFHQRGDRGGEAHALKLGADAARDAGDFTRAAELLRQSLAIRRQLAGALAHPLESAAMLAAAQGQAAAALRLAGAAAVLRENDGTRPSPIDEAELSRCVEQARRALGRTAADVAFAAGRAAELDEVLAEAAGRGPAVPAVRSAAPAWASPTARAAGLTPREWEVMGLLVGGASNQQIAERLTISPATAVRHVASIMAKLQAHSRTEAAARALGVAGT